MFDLKSMLGFVRGFLADFVPLTLLFLTLAFLAELLANLNEVPELLFAWQFWLAVAVNMLPAIMVTLIIFLLAGRFLKSVYGLDRWREGIDFLARSRFGQSGFAPYIKVEGGRRTLNAEGILTKIGGRGSLIVFNDSAVVLEQAGRLTQVKGPGFHKLGRFEKIYDIVDLQPKQWVYAVGAMTKEGIPVTWEAEVHYQIADGEQSPTPKSPYPFAEPAVFQAATCKWRREITRAQDMDWEGRIVIGVTEGALRAILARRHLDELIGLTEDDERAARESIQTELAEAIREPVAKQLAAKILQVKLANFQIKDAQSNNDATATRQWIEAWRTRWQGWSKIRLGEGEADRVYLYETVKAEAQVQYIIQITQALQNADINPAVIPAVLSMRLFSVLDRARAAQMMGMGEFPLSQIWDMKNQIEQLTGGAGNGAAEQPPPKRVYEVARPVSRPERPRPAPASQARIIPFRLPVIDEIAAGKAQIVSDDIIDYLQVDRLEAGGQPLAVELLKGSQVALYPEFSYVAAQFSPETLRYVDVPVLPNDYLLLQKPKWSTLAAMAEADDIVAVLPRDGGADITLQQLEPGLAADQIAAIAIARLRPEAIRLKSPAEPADSVPVGLIPIITQAAVGKIAPAPNDVIGYVYADQFEHQEELLKAELLKGNELTFKPGSDYFIMRVSGDSMNQAGIAPGDYVILQKASSGSLRPAAGDIVAVVFRDGEDDRATLKRLQINSGQVIFRPESSNRAHQPIILPRQAFSGDSPQVVVVGVAVGVLKS